MPKYHRIEGTVEDGELVIEYVPKGGTVQRLQHDEDVSGWTLADCRQCIIAQLDLDPEDAAIIEVGYA